MLATRRRNDRPPRVAPVRQAPGELGRDVIQFPVPYPFSVHYLTALDIIAAGEVGDGLPKATQDNKW